MKVECHLRFGLRNLPLRKLQQLGRYIVRRFLPPSSFGQRPFLYTYYNYPALRIIYIEQSRGRALKILFTARINDDRKLCLRTTSVPRFTIRKRTLLIKPRAMDAVSEERAAPQGAPLADTLGIRGDPKVTRNEAFSYFIPVRLNPSATRGEERGGAAWP